MPASPDATTIALAVLALIALSVAAAALWRAHRARKEVEKVSAMLRSRTWSESPTSRWHESRPEEAPKWLLELLYTLEQETDQLKSDTARMEGQIRQVGEPADGSSDVFPSRSPDVSPDVTHSGSPAALSDSAPPEPGGGTKSPAAERGKAVDLRDGSIVASRALAAPAFLITGEDEQPALVYLNENVEIDHLALERWSEYFDFGAGAAYRRYKTVTPARVEWDRSNEKGRLLSPGKAEVL